MKDVRDGVKVSIMDREFFVGCGEEERDALAIAANYLDKRMREVQRGGKVMGVERTAIMAALNISHEFLTLGKEMKTLQNKEKRVRSIQRKIEDVMQDQTELSV